MAKKKKSKKMDDFRKLHDKDEKGHVQYVFEREGKDFKSVGITHGKRTRGTANIPLKKNPDPKDPRKAYVRPKIVKKEAKKYGKPQTDMQFSGADRELVTGLIETLEAKPSKKSK